MDLALQLLVVGLSQAAIYSMVATGFGLILAVSHIFHFAHAAVFALAGFVAYAFIGQMGLPFWLGFLLSAALTVAAGLAMQAFVYSPLKKKNGNLSATVYMTPLEDLQSGTSYDGLAVGNHTVSSVNIYFNAGHPGVDRPHAHVVLFHDEDAKSRLAE